MLRVGVAIADLVVRDDYDWGAGSIIHDTSTGLDWLKPINTVNQSYASINAQLGSGQFTGFRYATSAEVNQLFANSGLTHDCCWDGYAYYNEYVRFKTFVNLFEPTHVGPSGLLNDVAYYVLGLTSAEGLSNPQYAFAEYSIILGHYVGVTNGIGFGELDFTSAGPNYGSWLIRSGKNFQTPTSYSVFVEQYSQDIDSIQLINPENVSRTATLDIFNPHPELGLTLQSQDPIAVAPGETVDVSLVIDAASAAVGVYDGILLEVAVDDGSTLYSNITIYVTEPDAPALPDLTVSAEDIIFSSSDGGATGDYSTKVCNRGNAPATQVEVQFQEFGVLVGNTIIPEVPAGGCKTASITPLEPATGFRVVTVNVDPDNNIPELDKQNNDGRRVVPPVDPPGGGGGAAGYIRVSGSASIGTVCPRSLLGLSGNAVYELLVNGVSNTDYVVKGGAVQMTADWLALYGDMHTDVNGGFRRPVLAPSEPGDYSVFVTVTDNTFWGTGRIDFTVVDESECVSGYPRPIIWPDYPEPPPPIGPLPPWEPIGPGVWEWTGPGAAQDVYVYSEDIFFSPQHPDPNENVWVSAKIHHFATRTDLPSGQVKVTFSVSCPGSTSITLPPIVLDNVPAGYSSPVFTTWKPITDGICIVEVGVDPLELSENGLNNAATRAIFVGQSVDPNSKIGPLGEGVEHLISGDDPLDYTVLFENLATATASAQEVVIRDQVDAATMDFGRVSLGPIAFGNNIVTPPIGAITYNTEVDLWPTQNLIVRVAANVNSSTGEVEWSFTSIDPDTGQPTTDPLTGFLPPNINRPEGSGSVRLTVMPKAGLPADTEICNQAEIVFDTNAPIVTPYWCNTLATASANQPPVADPNGPYSGTLGEAISFDGSGSTDADGTIESYDWDFGDGSTTGNGVSPSHTYTASGTYTVTLTVTDDAGAADMATTTAEIVNQPPIIDAGENVRIVTAEQNTTTIQGSASDADDDVLTYQWKEGDVVLLGTTPVGANGECPLDLSAVSLAIGDHTLTLEVTDGEATVTDEMILTIGNSEPNAAPTGGGVYEVGAEVVLGGDISDYDGDQLNYRWLEGTDVLDSGTIQAIAGGDPVALTPTPVLGFSLGIHTVTLEVSDDVNDPVSADIRVEVVDTSVPTLSPVPSETILWPPNHKMVDIVIEANAHDNSGQPPTLTVDVTSNEPEEGLGDGDMSPDWANIAIDQAAGIITLQLRAERSGSGDGRVYTIAITATDEGGNSSQAAVEIIVPHDKGKK
jgi:PKD repeat protein